MDVAVIYDSATGSVYTLAQAAADTAEKAGTQVRLRKVDELAPQEAIGTDEGWSRHALQTQHVEEASNDDLERADVVLLGSPTRYGLRTAQLEQFLDQTGPPLRCQPRQRQRCDPGRRGGAGRGRLPVAPVRGGRGAAHGRPVSRRTGRPAAPRCTR